MWCWEGTRQTGFPSSIVASWHLGLALAQGQRVIINRLFPFFFCFFLSLPPLSTLDLPQTNLPQIHPPAASGASSLITTRLASPRPPRLVSTQSTRLIDTGTRRTKAAPARSVSSHPGLAESGGPLDHHRPAPRLRCSAPTITDSSCLLPPRLLQLIRLTTYTRPCPPSLTSPRYRRSHYQNTSRCPRPVPSNVHRPTANPRSSPPLSLPSPISGARSGPLLSGSPPCLPSHWATPRAHSRPGYHRRRGPPRPTITSLSSSTDTTRDRTPLPT
jgi:hypothetical protein